tara:strand:- start:183 stop:419 length:237 start_codon:yes stop_codon:yes gene_type:complete
MNAKEKRARLCKMAEDVLRENPNRRLSAREIYSKMERRDQKLVPRNPTGLGHVLRSARPPITSEWYNGRRFYFLEGTE